MISIEEARELILSQCVPLPGEDVPLPDALGRVLATSVEAGFDVPPFSNSAMDGFAIVAADSDSAGADSPVSLEVVDVIQAGAYGERTIRSGTAAKIMTGAPLPDGADAVVEVEETRESGGRVSVFRRVMPWDNVRPAGEDSRKGEVVLPAGTVIGPAEIGVLASLGCAKVRVHGRPAVTIIATGSELVEPGFALGPGKIHNSNAYTSEAQCRELGLEPKRLGIAPDDYDATFAMMKRALSGDVLITSGGVSVGDFDFVKDVQDALGVERKLWRVAMKPGKPLSFGVYHRPTGGRCLVFGVPGNPAASMVSFELFIRPASLRLMGYSQVLRPHATAELAQDEPNGEQRVRVVRVRLERRSGRLVAVSTGSQGSGRLRSMVGANGLAFVPPDGGGRKAGDVVDVVVLRDVAEEG
ncbi:MAG: molybdopterin molybdotransferase MoeA [Actinobacteria bacterium]|nr:molybdopterin molybdotransferase MoeA [Actinomycetota bacterium]